MSGRSCERPAAGLRDLASDADGIGLVALDHPAVRAAIREVAADGTRIVTLVCDITGVPRHFYVGEAPLRVPPVRAQAIFRENRPEP